MTIADVREKSKTVLARVPRDVLVLAVLVLASTLSYGLGYLAGLDAGQTNVSLEITATDARTIPGAVVASKSGTKYYLPSCPGVARITDDNKVWFRSGTDAQTAGYSPAANCDGL